MFFFSETTVNRLEYDWVVHQDKALLRTVRKSKRNPQKSDNTKENIDKKNKKNSGGAKNKNGKKNNRNNINKPKQTGKNKRKIPK